MWRLNTIRDSIKNDYPTYLKRGSCCIKTDDGWIVDKEILQFIGEGRDYIEKLINVGE